MPWSRWADGGLVFLLGFLLWLLNHPYQGIRHDAQIYALLAAHWLNPEVFAGDLFFKFGSQGGSSLFTPLFGELVGWLGLGRAAWWVVFCGGLLWVGACVALARTMLGSGFAGRFAVVLGSVAVISYSPNLSTFMLGENFATARSWAIPLCLASVAGLAAKRAGLSLGFALAAIALHPLHGVWPLALWILARVRAQLAACLALLPLAVVVLLGVINPDLPYLRLMTGDWLEAAVGPSSDIVFQAPQHSRLSVYAGVLAALWLGARRGTEEWRGLYLRLLLLGCGGLGLALLAGYWFPVEIVVQGQPWRVLALLIPMAGLALVDLGQRAWHSVAAGRLLVGAIALIASMGTGYLSGALCVIAFASMMPKAWIERIEAGVGCWWRWLAGALVLLALAVLPNVFGDWEISGRQWVNPWLSGMDWLQGLVTGGTWHLAAVAALVLGWLGGNTPSEARRKPAMLVALVLVGLATMATLYHWDRRGEHSRNTQKCYLDERCPPHPFRQWIVPGSTVFWLGSETTVWFELGTASYFGELQAAGRVFSAAKFYEWQRRRAWIAAGTDPRHLCADPSLDWVVLTRSVSGLSPQSVLNHLHLYACPTLRAVLPAPTLAAATLQ